MQMIACIKLFLSFLFPSHDWIKSVIEEPSFYKCFVLHAYDNKLKIMSLFYAYDKIQI